MKKLALVSVAVLIVMFVLLSYVTATKESFASALNLLPESMRSSYLRYVLQEQTGFLRSPGEKAHALEVVRQMVRSKAPGYKELTQRLVPLLLDETRGGFGEPIPQMSMYLILYSENTEALEGAVEKYCGDNATITSMVVKARMHARDEPEIFLKPFTDMILLIDAKGGCSVGSEFKKL